MRISDWSLDVCSSDLTRQGLVVTRRILWAAAAQRYEGLMAASSVDLQQEFLSNQMEERRGRAPMVGLPLLGDFSSTGLEPRQFVVHGPSIRNGVQIGRAHV